MSLATNNDRARQLARTLLYEGYILYPYRASAIKNRHKWTFGTLYPERCAAVRGGSESSYAQAQVLLHANQETMLRVQLQFLQLVEIPVAHSAMTHTAHVEKPLVLDSNERDIEREVNAEFELQQALKERSELLFSFPATIVGRQQSNALGQQIDAFPSDQRSLEGSLAVSAEACDSNVFKITVGWRNLTPIGDSSEAQTELLDCMLSAHVILSTRDGEFVSLLDPSAEFREYSAQCENIGTFPVLAGDSEEADTFLCSPIALYDYPQVAPESAGDFFDATEIDELLTLRVLTLTDEEKKEMRTGDPRAAEILERTESLAFQHLSDLHGAVRSLKTVKANNEKTFGLSHHEADKGSIVRKGDRVRLLPNRRADILDIALAGRVGIVEAIEQDYDNRTHIAVVMEDDPGADLGFLRQPGHRFFFAPDEVELIPENHNHGDSNDR
jgi:hypothetical protein